MTRLLDFSIVIDQEGAACVEFAEDDDMAAFESCARALLALPRRVVTVPDALQPFYQAVLRLLDADLRRRGL